MDLREDSPQECLLNVCESTPNNEPILHKLLLDALRSKNFASFKNIIEHHSRMQSSIINVNYVHPNTEETYLDIASKNGLTEFVEFLLNQGAMPNKVNEPHNRAPIHFATEGGHANTLAVLLEAPMINPNLEAGQNTALHFAVRKNNLVCAELLLKSGASADILNNKGLAALHLAAMNSQRDMVELILKKSRECPDVDSYKDYNDQTTREVIQQNLPGISLPPKCENREINEHTLKNYLCINDELNFLKSMDLVKTEVLHGVAEELLKIIANKGFRTAAIEVLEKLKERRFSVKEAAEVAVQQSDHAILQLLLNVEPDVADDLVLSACKNLGMPGKRETDCTSNRLKCLKLILEQDNVNVRCSDSKGNTPLHYAARAGCREAVVLLLNRGSYIGHMNMFDVPPIADISANVLSRYFDDCLQTRKNRAKEYAIEFNYRCLMPHDIQVEHDKTHRAREMEVFKYIANSAGLKHLLKHPLLSSFLYLKWHRIRHILYANFAFYVIFYLTLNAYILSTTCDTCMGNGTQVDSNRSDRSLESTLRIVWYQNNSLQAVTAVMLLLFVLRELLQFISCVRLYLTSSRNWLKVTLIMLTVALLCGAGLQVGAVVILLSAWELVILISQYPRLSTGIEMFQTVSFNFIRFLFPYLFLILAFALAFYTLFKDGNDTNFPNPGLSLFKTVIMLTGEFDASDISFVSHPVWSHIVFMLFVFFIAIVLFNLLNGLAVNDTAEILSKAELVGLISRIRLIAYIEDIAIGEPFVRCFCCCNLRLLRWNPFSFFTKRILLFHHFLRDGKINVKVYDNLDIYDNDRYYEEQVRNEFIKDDASIKHDKSIKQWINLKMDPDIIKQAKCILYNKDQLTDNERIMIMLKKLQEKLTTLESNINNNIMTEPVKRN